MHIKRQSFINNLPGIIVLVVSTIVLIIAIIAKYHLEHQPISTITLENNLTSDLPEDDLDEVTLPADDNSDADDAPPFIDLQPTVNQWLQTLSNAEEAGIMIYDLNHDRIAASYQVDQVFDVASVYKLLFAYDGYVQIAHGDDNPDTIITTTADKGALTLSACLDLIIRESYNGCADIMNRDNSRVASVNQLIQTLGMSSTYNIGLESSATDLLQLLRHIWQHTELTSDLWEQLSDSMLHQPSSLSTDGNYYDWRQGLPAGFSAAVNVYNKVGWDWNGEYWDTYADTAIVDFLNFNRQYIIIVLTKNLSSHQKITQLGQMVEETVLLNS